MNRIYDYDHNINQSIQTFIAFSDELQSNINELFMQVRINYCPYINQVLSRYRTTRYQNVKQSWQNIEHSLEELSGILESEFVKMLSSIEPISKLFHTIELQKNEEIDLTNTNFAVDSLDYAENLRKLNVLRAELNNNVKLHAINVAKYNSTLLEYSKMVLLFTNNNIQLPTHNVDILFDTAINELKELVALDESDSQSIGHALLDKIQYQLTNLELSMKNRLNTLIQLRVFIEQQPSHMLGALNPDNGQYLTPHSAGSSQPSNEEISLIDSQNRQLHQRVNENKKIILSLENDIAKLNTSLQTFNEQIKTLNNESGVIKKELEECQESLSNSKANIVELDNEIHNLQLEEEKLNETLNQHKRNLEEEQIESAVDEAKLIKIQQEKTLSENVLKTCEYHKQKIEEYLKKCMEENEENQRKINELINKLNDCNKRESEIMQKVTEMTEENNSAKLKIHELEQQLENSKNPAEDIPSTSSIPSISPSDNKQHDVNMDTNFTSSTAPGSLPEYQERYKSVESKIEKVLIDINKKIKGSQKELTSLDPLKSYKSKRTNIVSNCKVNAKEIMNLLPEIIKNKADDEELQDKRNEIYNKMIKFWNNSIDNLKNQPQTRHNTAEIEKQKKDYNENIRQLETDRLKADIKYKNRERRREVMQHNIEKFSVY